MVSFNDAELPDSSLIGRTEKLSEFLKSHFCVSLMDYIPEEERAAIRDYTSTYNCDEAWTKAYNATGTFGGIVLAPSGKYTFATPKHIYKQIHIFGESSLFGGESSTRFQFGTNIAGFVFHGAGTKETGREVTPRLTSAAGSRFENVFIKGAGTSIATVHGIQLRCAIVMRHLVVDTFGGNGYHIDADLDAVDDLLYGNADGWIMENCQAARCKYGRYLNGANVSGVDMCCSFRVNRQWGDVDTSSSVVTDIMPHTATNGSGAVGTGAFDLGHSAQRLLLSPYTEQGQKEGTLVGLKTHVLGGLHGSFLRMKDSLNNVAQFANGIINAPAFKLVDGRQMGGFYGGIAATAPRQNFAWNISASYNIHFAYDAGGGALQEKDGIRWRWDTAPKTYRRSYGVDVAIEHVTNDLGSTASNTSKLKDELGTLIGPANLVYPRAKWYASLTDTDEYRKYVFTSGDLQHASYATVGNQTYSASDILCGAVVRDCVGAGRTDTLPTAELLLAAIQNVAFVGQIIECKIANGSDADEVITIAEGTGGTWDANQTATSRVISQNQSKDIRLRMTNVTPGSAAYSIAL